MTEDEKYMKLAIKEALKAKGKTLPNPCVGAVIVKDSKILSKGYHKKAGMPHAEIEAIEKANCNLKGATLYVTLEPCNHTGKTPPCTERIIKENFKRVVIGAKDPNPISGNGIKRLKESGIKVTVGILGNTCKEIIDDFFIYTTEKRAFVSLKLASTIDGKIATEQGESKWITSTAARREVHRLRKIHDAIMVGIGTVLKDDPLLTVRMISPPENQPKAIVIDRELKIPEGSKLISERPGETVILTSRKLAGSVRARYLTTKGVKLIPLPEDENKRLNIKAFLKMAPQMNIYRILVEGGSKTAWYMLEKELIDGFYIFMAPKILGGKALPMFSGGFKNLSEAKSVKITKIKRLGDDILISGYVNRRLLEWLQKDYS